ncbi:response regulator [Pilimelia columellifera]|uniref:Response regulator n=1 Tax=Pilimelia columellifera subsp. columellifera TaxID=706583 RepID=A0ABP6AXW9_9ACTN
MARITLTEDDDDLRSLVARMLDRAGHQVTAHSDGQAGLEGLRRRQTDLLVTDLEMPRMDGADMCSRAAAEGLLDGVPVIVISGSGSSLRTPPPTAVLRKPFRSDDLLEQIDKALADR